MDSRNISRQRQLLAIWHAQSDTTQLAERLAITFMEEAQGRFPKLPAKRAENTAKHHRKLARQVYRTVLHHHPHSFLAFILAVSPRRCRNYGTADFIKNHNGGYPPPLPHNVQVALTDIADRGGFYEDHQFLRLMKLLFQRPSTPAENITGVGFPSYSDASVPVISYEWCWVFSIANFQPLQASLGNRFSRIMGLTAHGLGEDIPKYTQCIQTVGSKYAKADALVHLKIELDDGLAQELFPDEYEKSHLATPGDGHRALAKPEVVFTTARVAALEACLPPEIYDVLEASELRGWEKEGKILEETRCAELKVHGKIGEPWGTLRLRLALWPWMQVANKFQHVPFPPNDVNTI